MAVVLRTTIEGQEWKLRQVRGHPCKAVGKKPCHAASDQDCGRGGNEKSGGILDVT